MITQQNPLRTPFSLITTLAWLIGIFLLCWNMPADASECHRSLEQTLLESGRTLPKTTINVRTVTELVNAVEDANTAGGNRMVLLEDGTYTLSQMLWISGENIAFRSRSGNRDAVIIQGQGMYGDVSHIFNVRGHNFAAIDLTIGWVANHAIQVHSNSDSPLIHNVRFVDTFEQMFKGSYEKGNPMSSERGIIEWCEFEYTAGIGPQWYIGGIDVHQGQAWIVRNNIFKHIRSPKSGTNWLAEHAIHFWSESQNTLVENNTIINCDRGIGFGLNTSGHINGIIRNNMIYTTRDVGIDLQHAENALVYNNTVYTENYDNAIEYRFSRSRNIKIINNLTHGRIRSRDGGTALLENNVTNANTSWFIDVNSGDLHLATAEVSVVDQGQSITEVSYDIDCEVRPQGVGYDIGADEIGSVSHVYEISGRVFLSDGTGLGGVILSGLPGNPLTNEHGEYRIIVEENWANTVIPQKTGYHFTPESRIYQNISSNLLHQDYQTIADTFMISGHVYNVEGNGIVDVLLNGLPGNPLTNEHGSYSAEVPADWSGTVTPQKTNYTFTPQNRIYNTLTGDQLEENYTGISRSSYFGFEEFGGTWHDAVQTVTDNMAWAAAAANILTWADWNTPIYQTAQAILEHIDTHWTDESGYTQYGWSWWLNGYQPTPEESSSQVDVAGSGNYWEKYNFFDYFYEDWANFSDGQWNNGSHLMETIENYLHSGYGVTLSISGDEGIHDLTVWGYEFDDLGNYTGLWVTNSMDALDTMALLSVNMAENLWYLDFHEKSWMIYGVQALERRPEHTPVPEPATLLLIGLGFLGLLTLKRNITAH